MTHAGFSRSSRRPVSRGFLPSSWTSVALHRRTPRGSPSCASATRWRWTPRASPASSSASACASQRSLSSTEAYDGAAHQTRAASRQAQCRLSGDRCFRGRATVWTESSLTLAATTCELTGQRDRCFSSAEQSRCAESVFALEPGDSGFGLGGARRRLAARHRCRARSAARYRYSGFGCSGCSRFQSCVELP